MGNKSTKDKNKSIKDKNKLTKDINKSTKDKNIKNIICKKDDKKYHNLENMEKIHQINLKYKVDPMILLKKENSFACGLGDGTIQIYCIEKPYSLQIEMKIHDSAINSIFESKIGELISCSVDSTIKVSIYNLKDNTFEIIKTLKGHKSDVYKVIQLEKKFTSELYTSCSKDKTIKIWNKKTCQTIQVYKNMEEIWCLLELSNYRIILPK